MAVEGEAEGMPAATADPNIEQKERLIAAVKKEVKQLMEEVRSLLLRALWMLMSVCLCISLSA